MRARRSARPGAGFPRLWTAAAVSNLGDGVTVAAGPLLLASISADPASVAGAVFAQQLPWLLFALPGGAVVDRLDRRRLVVAVNVLRAVALAVLTVTVATGTVTVPVVHAVVFLLGTGETLADTALGALVPAVVEPAQLPAANARLAATFTVVQQLLAKPLGAWLFAVAAAAPFGLNALTFAASAALLAGLRTPPPAPGTAPTPPCPTPPAPDPDAAPPSSTPAQAPNPDAAPSSPTQGTDPGPPGTARSPKVDTAPPAAGTESPQRPRTPADSELTAGTGRPSSLRAEIGDGVRWLGRHRPLRTLAVAMGLGNVAFGAAFAVFVLYCRERLGLAGTGYGLLLTAFAAGGLAGTAVAARLVRTVGTAVLLRAGLAVEAVTHLVLAVTTTPWVAAAVLAGFSVHAAVWGVVVVSARQRMVPAYLLGRVGSVFALLDLGGAAAGSLLGGLLATTWQVTTPFWTAAAVMAAVTVFAWRPLGAAAG